MTVYIATKGHDVNIETFEDWALLERTRGHIRVRDASRTPTAKRRDINLRRRRDAKRIYQRAFGAREWGGR